MARRIVLGTAGHIDHGKTSLIRALTGIETDRLKEEKSRGITIELGFAHLTLTDGQRIGVVDVPGHERFVRTMVAGATGIDLVALVIAADEGVMPQTREHIDVCQVLGVSRGLVVLTKTDMVEEEWLELVTEDVSEYLADTFLKDAPIVPVSSTTGDGIERLRAKLTELTAELAERQETGPFRLPVDRIFTMKGFGTVVTGTSVSGRIAVGDQAAIYPSGLTAKIRGLQVHGEDVEAASSGLRTAINLQGLERDTVGRGEVLTQPGALFPTDRLDAQLDLLPSARGSLKNRAQVRFHVGTADIPARIIPLSKEVIEPGESDLVQIVLQEEAACLPGDRYALRSFSPPLTIGGGKVLSVGPPRRKRFDAESLATLKTLTGGVPQDRLEATVAETRLLGISRDELMARLGLTPKEIDKPLKELLSKRVLIRFDKERQRFVHHRVVDELGGRIEAYVADFHAANPLKEGLPKEEIKTRLKLHADPKVITFQIGRSIDSGRLKAAADLIALADHRVSLAGDVSQIREKLLRAYAEGGLAPPRVKELPGIVGDPKAGPQIKDVLTLLVNEGLLIRAKEELFFDSKAILDLEARLVAHLQEKSEMTTQDFKEMTGLSRKYLIPLAEFFDHQGVTIRVGQVRRLREKLT